LSIYFYVAAALTQLLGLHLFLVLKEVSHAKFRILIYLCKIVSVILFTKQQKKMLRISPSKKFPSLLSHHIPMFLAHRKEYIEREERRRTKRKKNTKKYNTCYKSTRIRSNLQDHFKNMHISWWFSLISNCSKRKQL